MTTVNCKHYDKGVCKDGQAGGHPTTHYCARKCVVRLPIYGGLGNRIESVTKFFGIPTCRGCGWRRDMLSRMVPHG